jgi:hypothetical protein
MKKLILKLKTSWVVIFIFLALAVLETLRTRSWTGAGFWIAISVIFLIVGNMTKESQRPAGHQPR